MNLTALLFGIVPLVVFVIVDSFSGLRTALITAIVLALLETGLSLYLFGEIDGVTAVSLVLVIGMAAVSYYTESSIYFKVQPAILSLLFGVTFLVTYWMEQPILYTMAMKYKEQLPPMMGLQLSLPLMQKMLQVVTHFAGYAMLAHGLLVGWAAVKLSNWWWITIRVVGLYLFLGISVFITRWYVMGQYPGLITLP